MVLLLRCLILSKGPIAGDSLVVPGNTNGGPKYTKKMELDDLLRRRKEERNRYHEEKNPLQCLPPVNMWERKKNHNEK